MEIRDTVVKVNNSQIIIPEVLHPDYGMFLWPCSRTLTDYLCTVNGMHSVNGAHVVELGAGTSLPGVAALHLGAASVTLTDLHNCLPNCSRTATRNGLSPVMFDREHVSPFDAITMTESSDYNTSHSRLGLDYHSDVSLHPPAKKAPTTTPLTANNGGSCFVAELNWGRLDKVHQHLAAIVDVILAADCFYDSHLFEPLSATIAYLLRGKRHSMAIVAYHQRDSFEKVQHILDVWKLKSEEIIFAHDYGDIKLFKITNKI